MQNKSTNSFKQCTQAPISPNTQVKVLLGACTWNFSQKAILMPVKPIFYVIQILAFML